MTSSRFSRLQAVWEKGRIVDEYESEAKLFHAERVIIDKHLTGELFNAVLDIGIGAGRTVEPLSQMASHYTGIDYSRKMVQKAYRSYPYHDIRVMDATNLYEFGNDTFDLVFFSFNGIDCIGPNERVQALKEVWRVLRPDGIFVFSSHNLYTPRLPSYSLRNIRINRGPLKFARSLFGYALKNLNYFRLKNLEYHGNEYSMLVDRAHHYGVVLYYTTIQRQKQQLNELNFVCFDMIDVDGVSLGDDMTTTTPWVYYVARKN